MSDADARLLARRRRHDSKPRLPIWPSGFSRRICVRTERNHHPNRGLERQMTERKHPTCAPLIGSLVVPLVLPSFARSPQIPSHFVYVGVRESD